MLFLSQLVNGLQLGSIYALIALGYSMVYGIIMLLNFAHGDVIMVGGYIALFSLASGLHPAIAVALAISGCALLAVTVEKLAYKPLRAAPRISLLITAIGISMLLQNLAQLFFSPNARSFLASAIVPSESLAVMPGLNISVTALVTIAASVASMAALTFLVHRTKMGKAMRAVSEDTGAAQLMGIDVNKVISFTFAIGAALAGIGSILYCCRYPLVSPTMGALPGLKAFVAAVFGGIGSIPGAMVGGFAIGFAEVLVTSNNLSNWTDGIVFAILIVILLFKPTGILGRSAMEKV